MNTITDQTLAHLRIARDTADNARKALATDLATLTTPNSSARIVFHSLSQVVEHINYFLLQPPTWPTKKTP